MLLDQSWTRLSIPYLVILVHLSHPPIALALCNDLPRVFYNYLIGFKGSVAANSIPTICRLDYFNSNIILAAGLVALAKIFEAPVSTVFTTDVAIVIVAFVKHESIEAVLITAGLGFADALGLL
jgi:hypothetical protein